MLAHSITITHFGFVVPIYQIFTETICGLCYDVCYKRLPLQSRSLLFNTAKLVIFGELSSLQLSVSANAVLLTLFKQSTFRYSEQFCRLSPLASTTVCLDDFLLVLLRLTQ